MKRAAFCAVDSWSADVIFAVANVGGARRIITGEWRVERGEERLWKIPCPAEHGAQDRSGWSQAHDLHSQKGAQGEVTSEYHYTTDGKPVDK